MADAHTDTHSLDEAELIAAAKQATGLENFGGEDFRPGLRALIETYQGYAFSEKGRKRNRRRLISLLSTRLQLEAQWKRHPELLDRPVKQPLVLTGLPRSGTSALFNLLAEDPLSRPIRLWETQFPYPPEGWTEDRRGQPDPRRDAMEAYYAQGREKNPDFTRIHFASADTPEECVLIQAYSLAGVQLGTEVMMEPYGSWFRAQDQQPVYELERRILQLLDWQRPGERWLLKSPAHMWGIDALVRTFPDVGIVWGHRTPLRAIASMCSMTRTLMKTRLDLEPRKLGPLVMDFYATSLDRGLAARERLDRARFIDVTHDDFVSDSMGTVERIYRHFGLDLGGEARAAMEARVTSHPKDQHGRHDYGLVEFGLTVEEVEERFAPYVERFQLTWK